MAVDDVSFYNLLGEEINRGNLVQQMIDYYIMKLEVGDTKITDFNEGSEIRNLLEAFAVDLYILLEEQNELISIGFIDSAEGEWLDMHGANPFIKLQRDTGNEATGFVTFSIPEGLINDDVVIEEGTLLSSDDGLEFATDGEAVILSGETSVVAAVTCLTTGVDGNVPADSITSIDDEYINIEGLTVTNADALTNGTDYEEDDEYRERLLAYIRQDDFGSAGYYYRLGEEIPGVHDIVLVDKTGFTKNILVNGDVKPATGGKAASDSVILEVLEVFSNLENIVVDHTFSAEACLCDDVDLTLNLTMQEEIEDEIILNVLAVYFNGGTYDLYEFEGVYINDMITGESLIDVLTLIEEINDIEILDGNGDPLTEISPGSNHVLKLGDVDINQTIG